MIQCLSASVNAIIYLAYDTWFERKVVLKILPSTESKGLGGFRRKYQFMVRCRHPNLIPVYELHLDPMTQLLFYSMEWMDHCPLESRCWDLTALLQLTIQLCHGLSYIHRQGYLFSNLIPSHILLDTSTENVRIKMINYSFVITGRSTTEITRDRNIHYLAPELIEGRYPDHRVDLYELGVLLYELATRQKLFQGDIKSILKQHRDAPPPPAGIDPQFDAILLRLLAKNPDERFFYGEDVIVEIQDKFARYRESKHFRTRRTMGEGLFVDRKEEMTQMNHLWEEILVRRTGSIAVVEGHFGIGKRRFLREWSAIPKSLDIPVLEMGSGNGEIRSFSVLHRFLTKHAYLGLEQSFDNNIDRQWMPLTEMSPASSRNGAASFFDWDCLKRKPVILIVTQFKSLSESLKEFIRLLASRIHEFPCLLCICRTPEDQSWNHHSIISDTSRSIALKPLEHNHSYELLSSILMQDFLPNKFISMLDFICSGVPYFIEEFLRASLRTGDLQRKDNEWHFESEKLSKQSVIPRIKKILMARSRSLPNEPRVVMEMMAVLNRMATSETIGQFISVDDLQRYLDILIHRGILLRVQSGPIARYKFVSPSMRTAIYHSIPLTKLQKLHATVAIQLEEKPGSNPLVIAYHWLRTGDQGNTVKAVLRAVAFCLDRGAFLNAEQWIHQIDMDYKELSPLVVAEIKSQHAIISYTQHRNHEVLDKVYQALALLPGDTSMANQRARLYQYSGQAYFRMGQFENALGEFEKSRLELVHSPASHLTATLHIMTGVIYFHKGHFGVSSQCLDEANNVIRQLNNTVETDEVGVMCCILSGDLAFQQNDLMKAGDCYQSAISVCLRHNLKFYTAVCWIKSASVHIQKYEFDAAAKLLEQSMKLFKRSGMYSEMAWGYRLYGEMAMKKFEFTQAQDFFRKAFSIARRTDRQLELLELYRAMGELDYLQGDIGSASHHMKTALEKSLAIGAWILESDLHEKLGYVCIETSEFSEAIQHFQTSLTLNRSMSRTLNTIHLYYGLALLYWILNARKRAKHCIACAQEQGNASIHGYIMGKIHLLKSQILRYERIHEEADQNVDIAAGFFAMVSCPVGLLIIRLIRIREMMDQDISADVWNEALNLWEEIRHVNIWELKMEAALVMVKLSLRRNDYSTTRHLLDTLIRAAKEERAVEYHWRALRIRSRMEENEKLHSAALESLETAWNLIQYVLSSIPHPRLQRCFLARADIMAIRSSLEDLRESHANTDHNLSHFPEISPRFSRTDMFRTQHVSEKNRLYRRAIQKIRQSLKLDKIFAQLMPVVLKLSRADRAFLFLTDEQEHFKLIATQIIGISRIHKLESFQDAGLFSLMLQTRKMVYCENIQTDERFCVAMKEFGLRAFLCVPMFVQDRMIGILYIDSRLGTASYLEESAHLIQDLVDDSGISIENARLYSELEQNFMGMVRAFVAAMDAKDPDTRGHSDRVASYAIKIGTELVLSPKELRNLELSAILHDIGKLVISQHILDSVNELDTAEWETMQHHAEIGGNILSQIKSFGDVWLAVKQHHERFDGKGYPAGLRGEDIVLNARIIAVADTLDAMTMDRPYQKAVPMADAVNRIRNNAGTQFDPIVVGAMLRLWERSELG